MREKILELLNKKDFVSGVTLAKQLNVSRTAICKQIKTLRNYNYKIESIKNRGYRLISRPDIPRYEEISPYLNTRVIGKKIVYFNKIDSTNIYAKKLAKEGDKEGCVVIADVQEKGRGRKNRIWFSPEGGLWFSVILYPKIPPQNAMIITMAASISIAEAIKKNTNLKPVIKWPNDLLFQEKKICGIFTELDAEMDWINYAVIGIGINVNNFINKDLRNIATSLKIETKKEFSRVKLLADILNNFDINYSHIKSGNIKFIRDTWFSYTNIIGRDVKVNNENVIVEGIVIDVDNEGCLILDTNNGIIRVFSGDITYI